MTSGKEKAPGSPVPAYDILRRTIGLRVAEQRARTGLSHYALANALGVRRTFIEGVERGEHNLTLAQIARLAATLNIEPFELLRTTTRSGNGS